MNAGKLFKSKAETAFDENEIIEINSLRRQKLVNHFYQQNLKIKKYTGVDYNG